MNLEERVDALEADQARLKEEIAARSAAVPEPAVATADETADEWYVPLWKASEVRVDPAGTAAAGEILTIQRAAYAAVAQLYCDPFLPPLTQTYDELHRELARSTVLTARMWARMVGAVRARAAGDVWRIARLVVVPDLQGRGTGSRLLTAIEQAAPEGIREFALFTGARSEATLRLYERHGYRVSHHEQPAAGPEQVHLVKGR